MKDRIFQNLRDLKGKEVYFAHDLTRQQREEYNHRLRSYLSELRSQNISNCRIKGNKIYVDNTAYTLAEIEELQGIPLKRRNSAPSTPIVGKYQEQTQETPKEQRAVQRSRQLTSESIQGGGRTLLVRATEETGTDRQKPTSAGTSGTLPRGTLSSITKERIKTRSNK